MKKRTAYILICIWLMVMAGIASSAVTLILSEKTGGGLHWISKTEADTLKRYSRIESIRETLENGYYRDIDNELLMNGAINGMLAALQDPYTYYYTPQDMQKHDEKTEGEYQGLGILVQINENADIEVIRVYENSPAEEAGLQTGDVIRLVNGKGVNGENQHAFDEAVALMQNDGDSANLTIQRGEKRLEIDVRRDIVNITNVIYSIIDEHIGYLNIRQFTGDDVTAYLAAQEALQEAEVDQLIIDVRNNPGGLLDDVVAITDELLPEGMIVYTEDREGVRENFYSDADYWDIPMAILVNDMSASASEIFAAAMQDFDRAAVIGSNTYGKGVVQTLIRFDEDGAGVQYTSSCYYAPSGRSINGCGVTPDIIADGSSDNQSDIPDPEKDAALKTAIDYLNKR